MNEFMSQTGYWLVPLIVGAALAALSWFSMRQFFWRIVLCMVPLVVAFIVTLNAWYNLQRPDVNVGPIQILTDGPFPRAVDYYSLKPIIDPQAIRAAAGEWFKNKRSALERQLKVSLQDPSDFFEVEGIGAQDGSRYDRVRLKFRIWEDKTSPKFVELASSQGNELVAAVTSSLSPSGARFNLGVDLAGGTILVYEVDRDWYASMQKEGRMGTFDSANLAAVLKRRIDPANLLEITIRPVKTEPPRVEIILPVRSGKGGVQSQAEIERVKSLISQVGKLEFRILADATHDNEALDGAKALTDNPTAASDLNNLPAPDDYAWVELDLDTVLERKFNTEGAVTGAQRERDGTMVYHAPTAERSAREPAVGRYFILTKLPTPDVTVTGEDLTNARPFIDDRSGRWVTLFSVKGSASDRMYDLTKPAVGRWLAVVMDRKVQSYANIRDPLRDSVQVSMGGGSPAETKRKVDRLVQVLQSGSLPATLRQQPVSELTMGPTLGQDTIDKGSKAIVGAFIVVVLFMIVYYRLAGGIASVALFANLLLTIGFMVLVKAAFTLPGLAGLVLMLGMAVDANVLIYERVREERERGANLAMAIRNGYDRAFPTIIDTHLTSIFTAIVLYAVGNDQLKGFGVSLTVGLIISLFTSLFMTRTMFDVLLSRGLIKELRMMKFFAKPNIDFMRVRYYWFVATLVLSLFGLTVFVLRGDKGLNIDFTGGTAYSIEFKEPQGIERVRTAISNSALPDPTVDAIYPGTADTGELTRYFTFRTTLKDRDLVRDVVAKTYGDELLWSEVHVGKVEDVADARLANTKLIPLTFTNKKVSEAELSRIVNTWLAGKGILRPDDFFKIQAGGSEKATEDRLNLQITMPDGVPVDELTTYLSAKGGPLYQPKSERLENFDSQLATEVQSKALAAIALSWLAISLYLWFRFGSWTFGLAAVLCLIHDLMFTIGIIGFAAILAKAVPGLAGLLMLEEFKLDLPAVAALLTLIGFSVNDTIVVFDRIREIRGKSPELTPQMINDSVNGTLSRTLLTSMTTWLVVIVLYLFGGEGVHLFAFVMVVGVIVGSYSSIFVASPLLLMFGEGKQKEPARGRLQPQEAGV